VLGFQVDFKDLFHIVKTNLNTLKHFMSRKLNKFCHYPLNVNRKCALSWWQMKSHKFLTIAKHIMGILASQIKIQDFIHC